MSGRPRGREELAALLAPLLDEPARSAVLLDLDGTLAPIVGRPEDTEIPAPARELLGRVGERFGLAGIVTGRRAADARRIAGLDSFLYIGNHGFELLEPGAETARPAPALAGSGGLAAEFAAGLDPARLETAGLRIEDKGPIVALHWRGAADEPAAAAEAARIAADAQAAGLHTHDGRKVLELRPPVPVDKGVGIAAVLAEADLAAALYAGDDRTDLDGFEALRRLVAEGALRASVAIAVVADETPPEVAAGADLSVAGPEEFLGVLEALV